MNTQQDTKEFLHDYALLILKEAGLEENPEVASAVEERVAARMLLEMVNMLTPEEADKVKRSMEGDFNQEAVLRDIAKRIPDFNFKMAFALANVKQELVEDVAGLAKN